MDLAELKIKYWDKIREELRPSFLGESTERDYATYIHLKLRELDYPLTFEAFDDYEFGVATSRLRLLRPDQKVILNDHISEQIALYERAGFWEEAGLWKSIKIDFGFEVFGTRRQIS